VHDGIPAGGDAQGDVHGFVHIGHSLHRGIEGDRSLPLASKTFDGVEGRLGIGNSGGRGGRLSERDRTEGPYDGGCDVSKRFHGVPPPNGIVRYSVIYNYYTISVNHFIWGADLKFCRRASRRLCITWLKGWREHFGMK